MAARLSKLLLLFVALVIQTTIGGGGRATARLDFWDSAAIRLPSEKDKTEDAVEQSGTTWAVLVAGSNGYGNYRHQVRMMISVFLVLDLYLGLRLIDLHIHIRICIIYTQADVCHAYQILKKGGLKEENIVVFMYDDIAMHEMNPRKGIIINHPQGQDVYAGVPKVPS